MSKRRLAATHKAYERTHRLEKIKYIKDNNYKDVEDRSTQSISLMQYTLTIKATGIEIYGCGLCMSEYTKQQLYRRNYHSTFHK